MDVDNPAALGVSIISVIARVERVIAVSVREQTWNFTFSERQK